MELAVNEAGEAVPELDESALAAEDESPQPEEMEPPPELEEVEHEGKKYQIPKPLKGALLMQADYTRKTQEVAEQRRAVEEQQRQYAEFQRS